MHPTIADLTYIERDQLWQAFNGRVPRQAIADKIRERGRPAPAPFPDVNRLRKEIAAAEWQINALQPPIDLDRQRIAHFMERRDQTDTNAGWDKLSRDIAQFQKWLDEKLAYQQVYRDIKADTERRLDGLLESLIPQAAE